MAPSLVADGEDLLLSWLEPGVEMAHRFLVARLHAGRWSEPAAIAEGNDFFANWADVPKVGVAGDGVLWAHWLAKIGGDTYAYGIFLARSTDGGASWQPMGTLHDDAVPAEHGFVAYAPAGEALRAVWLDGRAMVDGGAMSLRTAVLGETVGPSVVLDDRVCECCPAELVEPASGAVAFYRDRSLEEVRNIAVTRLEDESWTAPEPLHDDGWMIPGCPVNGPAAAASGDRVAVAWFTAANDEPKVQLAFSSDGGRRFGEPWLVDGERPLGRVDLVFDDDDTVWVSWLAVVDKLAEVRVAHFDGSGPIESRTVAATGASRASGIPRLARAGGRVFVAWVETVDDRPAEIRLAAL